MLGAMFGACFFPYFINPPSLNPATRFWVNPTMRKGLMLKFSPYALDSLGEDAADAA